MTHIRPRANLNTKSTIYQSKRHLHFNGLTKVFYNFASNRIQAFNPPGLLSKLSDDLKFSQAIVLPPNASLVVTSGQCGFRKDGSVPEDVHEQIGLSFSSIEKTLHVAWVVQGWTNVYHIMTASISITRTCLIYLTDIRGSHEEAKEHFPMARYAAELWTGYAALAQDSEDIVQKTVKFIEEEVTFQRWSRLYQADRSWADDPGPPRASKLYYACLNRLLAAARVLITKGEDIDAQGGEYGKCSPGRLVRRLSRDCQTVLNTEEANASEEGYHADL